MELSNRVNRLSPSLSVEITGNAKKMLAQGKDVILMSVGEPDFPVSDNIKDAIIKSVNENKTTYTISTGVNELKDAIINKFKNDNSLEYNKENIIVGAGAKQLILNCILSLIDPGDEVLIPVPYWVSYPEMVKLAEGKSVFINPKNDDLKITVNDIKEKITDRTKIFIFNSPSNPTGIVYSKDEICEIAKFLEKRDIVVISDEIYEKLIYDKGFEHYSIAQYSEKLKENTVIINGVSKSHCMTGLRIGYASGDEKIIKAMSKIQSHEITNPASTSQFGAVEALNGSQDYVEMMKKEFKERRDYIYSELLKIDGLKIVKPGGAFYLFLNISEFLNREINGKKISNSFEFSKIFLDEKLVASVPGSSFGMEGYIRISYALNKEKLNKALERLKDFISELK